MDSTELISVIKDITTAIVAIIGVGVAIAGLSTWRKQIKGKTEYDLARRLLKSIYKIRDSIPAVRNPFQLAGEIEAALRESRIEPEGTLNYANTKAIRAVYTMRWNKLRDSVIELNV